MKMNPEAIVFDKDGTLVDFNQSWGAWLGNLVLLLEKFSGFDNLKHDIFDLFGFDEEEGKIFGEGSILAWATYPEMKTYLKEYFTAKKKLKNDEVEKIFEQTFAVCDDGKGVPEGLGDIRLLFEMLTNRGIKIAVVTSDQRH